MSQLNYQDGYLEDLQAREETLVTEIRQLKGQLDRRNAYRYELQYQDPEPNFDRRKVRGMVGKLFRVRDERDSLALMMCAGGHLYSYVTDDDETSKKILQKGQLQHRITIIPLNKITSSSISPQVVRTAQNLVGEDNVASALSLIEYNKYYEPVMRFIFGHTLICKDMNIAKQVTYHKNVMCRSVTLEGDVVDPEGTLSGGSKPKGSNILQELAEIRCIEEEIMKKEEERNEIIKQIAAVQNIAKRFNTLKQKLDLKQHELNACSERLSQTTFQRAKEEIDKLKEKIESLQQEIMQAKDKERVYSEKVKDIEFKLTDAKGYRERELKAATDAMKEAKRKSEESQANWKKREQEYETLRLEIEEMKKSIENSMTQVQELTEAYDAQEKEMNSLKKESECISLEISELKRKVQGQKDKINTQNKELRICLSKKDKLGKQNQELQLDMKKKENEMIKMKTDNKEAFAGIENLEKKYSWIKEDEKFFGSKNTMYDYSKEEPVEAGRKLRKLQEQKEKMERHINLKAMMLLDREEEQYNETMRRKKIVEEDKEKIKHIIWKMDEKKKEKVEKAWKNVDENFSSIFSSLLEGAQAKLKPVYHNNNLFGLEIKVGFNGVWKESLAELSGGQRSLVALSLVLAMLKFCPAPLYILDEVDAALDMSHTQNIGNMLKAHFTNSQFIIVSLKDGMFNNANVLFQTKFEEGVSAVTRTVSSKNLH